DARWCATTRRGLQEYRRDRVGDVDDLQLAAVHRIRPGAAYRDRARRGGKRADDGRGVWVRHVDDLHRGGVGYVGDAVGNRDLGRESRRIDRLDERRPAGRRHVDDLQAVAARGYVDERADYSEIAPRPHRQATHERGRRRGDIDHDGLDGAPQSHG